MDRMREWGEKEEEAAERMREKKNPEERKIINPSKKHKTKSNS